MREFIQTAIFMAILFGMIYMQFRDEASQQAFFRDMRQHHAKAHLFYEEIGAEFDEFMRQGDRNTAQQGFALCRRVELLEIQVHGAKSDTLDCKNIYFQDGD